MSTADDRPALSESQLEWARKFVRTEIRPLDGTRYDGDLRRRLIDELGQHVRDAGMWAPHLPRMWGGAGVSTVSLCQLFEILGTAELAPVVFGCWPPDSVNAQLLAEVATGEQNERWLRPLAAGAITSAFAMTEPEAGSDPTRLVSRAFRDGDSWVLNGRKWWITNGSRADLIIGLFVTDPDESPHRKASLFLVPADSPGLEVVREIGHVLNPNANENVLDVHAELTFKDVRVPEQALLGEPGAGFALAQKRLASARLQHCMRWVGMAEAALDLACRQAQSRQAHGSLLIEKANVQHVIASVATDIHLSRLLLVDTATGIDRIGSVNMRREIAMCKVFIANMLYRTIDDVMQIHGARGMSTDLPLERWLRFARLGRVLDGPDEVHEMSIARLACGERAKRADQ